MVGWLFKEGSQLARSIKLSAGQTPWLTGQPTHLCDTKFCVSDVSRGTGGRLGLAK